MKKRISIPLVEFDSKVPVVKLNLGDRELFALVDTGSESTLFDKNLDGINGIKKKELDHDMSFVGLQGKADDFKVVVLRGTFRHGDDKVKIGGISADLSTIGEHFKRNYNSDITISMLLGSDFLKEHNARIDYRNNTLSIETD